jgi:HD-GYP domain-containing protein (c-di-GMP phosphodiesterase class II)
MAPSTAELEYLETTEGLVVALARAMKNISFYDVDHPAVQDVLTFAHRQLTIYLAGTRDFAVQLVGGYVVIGGKPMVSPQASVGNLMGACHRRGVESLTFHPGVSREELAELIRVLIADPEELVTEGGASAALVARQVTHITAERFRRSMESDWRWVHAAALDVLRNAALGARTGRSVDLGGVQTSIHGILDSLMGDPSILDHLIPLRGMDEYTFVHALHTCVLACELGRRIGLSRVEQEELGVSTLLHDVGKVFVPLGILRKPGALDAAEFAAMKRHPVDGAVVLARETRLPQASAVVAFEHHMHLDRSGYPEVSGPRQLHLYSMMTNITDVYDALTTTRPYRPAMSPHRALHLMRNEMVSHFEPRLLRHFMEALGPYPWGTLLKLPDGRLAVVSRRNVADMRNPYVRCVLGEGSAGRPRLVEEEVLLRLHCAEGENPEVLDPASLGLDVPLLLQGT